MGSSLKFSIAILAIILLSGFPVKVLGGYGRDVHQHKASHMTGNFGRKVGAYHHFPMDSVILGRGVGCCPRSPVANRPRSWLRIIFGKGLNFYQS
ncbi:uncharacterized protein LOC18429260 isoform X2 [Amborella trichopoda]|uniref:uncharacterized protein LOC18429260 isoform X2 n=1 Tax=Amborella trichopoda TaxID=13333 RepID=UPI0009C02FDF|nr:uncharacterized protein LOC18429260 isoform X2 [Amborella trichopoda]|eukprot:XP_020519955.1 uncharacterized protein LOC18429260 isoform X2 [Amborella trichopoda]